MIVSIDQILNLLGRELLIWRKTVLAIFILVNIAGVAVGLSWPNSYVSSTTIFVEEKNILDPLMEGAAVRTPVLDHSRIAQEVIFGKRVMDRLADDLGLFAEGQTELERDRIIGRLRDHTTITHAGRSLIRIEHRDNTAEFAFKATRRVAELFILESHERKLEESKAAYGFIDKQVQDYHSKLRTAEEALKKLRVANIDAGADSSGTDIVTRINQISARIDQIKEQLRDAEIKGASLEKQLSGEAETSVVLTRVGQFRTRISELQSQLDTLRLTYHDTHPDIVRIRHQIDDLHQSVRSEETRRQGAAQGGTQASADSRPVRDEDVIHNPLYQQLRMELSQTKTLIDTLRARSAELTLQLRSMQDRGKAAHSVEAQLAEVTRDYQVNNTLYQDLLRRREQALVSMNINKERQGLGFSIQEAAQLPLHPTGLRLMYVLLISSLLSVLIPAGLLFALVRFDPRIRIPSVITEQFKVPVLAVVPHLWSPHEVRHFKLEMRWSVVLTLSAAILIGALLFLRNTKGMP